MPSNTARRGKESLSGSTAPPAAWAAGRTIVFLRNSDPKVGSLTNGVSPPKSVFLAKMAGLTSTAVAASVGKPIKLAMPSPAAWLPNRRFSPTRAASPGVGVIRLEDSGTGLRSYQCSWVPSALLFGAVGRAFASVGKPGEGPRSPPRISATSASEASAGTDIRRPSKAMMRSAITEPSSVYRRFHGPTLRRSRVQRRGVWLQASRKKAHTMAFGFGRAEGPQSALTS